MTRYLEVSMQYALVVQELEAADHLLPNVPDLPSRQWLAVVCEFEQMLAQRVRVPSDEQTQAIRSAKVPETYKQRRTHTRVGWVVVRATSIR